MKYLKIIKNYSWDHYAARCLKNIKNLYNKKYLKLTSFLFTEKKYKGDIVLKMFLTL